VNIIFESIEEVNDKVNEKICVKGPKKKEEETNTSYQKNQRNVQSVFTRKKYCE